MQILILGGDGFCGWPTALHLSACGHDVTIVDNFARRQADEELQAQSLTPIQPLETRLEAWTEVTGREIGFQRIDVAREYDRLVELIRTDRPDAVVHFAEQRAAPYSMKSPWHKRYTVDNNTNATHNLLAAIVDAQVDTHVVHLGTMGVYGYGTAGTQLPEGYQTVRMDAADGGEVEQEILYPVNPGSVYHLTKTLDQLMFAFYAKNDELRITDLHQGIVWGTQTPETSLDERLDQPLRLRRRLRHGPEPLPHAGGDRLPAHRPRHGRPDARLHPHPRHGEVHPARVENAPERGERVRIYNQMTEVHRVIDLAGMIARIDRLGGRPRREPAQGGQPQRAAGRQRQPHRPRPGPRHPAGRPADGGHRDRAALRGPLRPRAHPLHVALGAQRGRGGTGAPRRRGVASWR